MASHCRSKHAQPTWSGKSQSELQASIFPLLESVPLEHGGHRERTPPEPTDYSSLGSRTPSEWRYRDVVDVKGEPSGVFFSVPIRNVGQGFVLISGSRPQALSVPDVTWTLGESSRPMIPSAKYARINFRLNGLREDAYAEVFYSDVCGNQPGRLRIYIKGEADESTGQMGYFVKGTALYDDDGNVPLAISGDPRVADPQPSRTGST
jgi:hypothetical protein